MRHVIAVACCVLASLSAGMAFAKLPPPTKKEIAEAAAAKAKAAAEAKKAAAALARAQDRVVAHYKGVPLTRVERLSCVTGDEDRHARIGVELVNDKVNYFAFYSKWKPRACSIEVRRGGPYSRWEDRGSASSITLVDGKGLLVVDGKSGRYRIDFRGIDRERYCGMDGKINGSLTILRGRRACLVEGVMDGHAG